MAEQKATSTTSSSLQSQLSEIAELDKAIKEYNMLSEKLNKEMQAYQQKLLAEISSVPRETMLDPISSPLKVKKSAIWKHKISRFFGNIRNFFKSITG